LKITTPKAVVLADRFIQATEMVQESKEYFQNISSTVSETLRMTWNQEIKAAEKKRLHDPSVMDILGAEQVKITAAPDHSRVRPSTAADEWLEFALAIEEKQYGLRFSYRIFLTLKQN
jgi:hypothetical protein